jgi:asparagine synthase (glutamine-hydrolysing)
MCGICGFVSFDQKIGESTLLDMNASITRRGPDGDGHFFDGTVGLAMRRLAIIDLEGGRQPIFNEDRSVCVVFNGEIYNYRELRERLLARGHTLATHSDTETIVHLYEEYGERLSEHLQGMFAFALWDLRKRTLLLSRDRLGIKPLFIATTPQGVLFGSEIKTLIASGLVPRRYDWQALDEFFTYTNIPQPRTIYADVRQVEPGTSVRIAPDGSQTVTRYWSVPAVEQEPMDEAAWLARLDDSLRDAVQSHLVSDVPVGAFLSGGVDSGVMVAMMATLMDRPVETFTVSFTDAGSSFIDERQYARAMAQRYRLNYHEIEVTPHLDQIASEVSTAFDQPFADDSVVPSYYVCQIAGQQLKVALTGLGGDELFAGYRRHYGLMLGEKYARLPRWLRSGVIEPLVRRLPESAHSLDSIDHLKRFVRAGARPAPMRYQDSMATLSWSDRAALYAPGIVGQIDQRATDSVLTRPFEDGDVPSILERALRTDLKTYLVDDILTLSDRLSMWHSLELRVPYLDHRLVETAARVPASLKIRGSTQKYILKRLAEKYLPHDMIYHKKQGFEAPMGRWLRGPLLPFFDSVVTPQAVASTGVLRYDTIRRLRDEHVGLKRKNSKILFSILSFMLWARQADVRA